MDVPQLLQQLDELPSFLVQEWTGWPETLQIEPREEDLGDSMVLDEEDPLRERIPPPLPRTLLAMLQTM